MPRSVVTGGAGFIGSHLARSLVSRGDRVCVLDDFSAGERSTFDRDAVEFIQADIRQRDAVARALDQADLVFHQAARVSVPSSIEDPSDCYQVNLNGTLNVLWAAEQAKVDRVVLASSAAVYGDARGPVAEDVPQRPISPYAASKLAMETAALMYHNLYGLPVVCLRYFNVYGPGQRPNSTYAAVIPAFIQAMLAGEAPVIYGGGNQRRDFVHVDDVVRANELAAGCDDAVGQVLNISGGGAVTVNELADILHGIIPDAPAPIYSPPREGDIYFSEAVLDRAESALGYRPEVGLEEGLRSTVEWFRQSQAERQN